MCNRSRAVRYFMCGGSCAAPVCIRALGLRVPCGGHQRVQRLTQTAETAGSRVVCAWRRAWRVVAWQGRPGRLNEAAEPFVSGHCISGIYCIRRPGRGAALRCAYCTSCIQYGAVIAYVLYRGCRKPTRGWSSASRLGVIEHRLSELAKCPLPGRDVALTERDPNAKIARPIFFL